VPQEIQKIKSQGPKGIAFTVDLSGNSSYNISQDSTEEENEYTRYVDLINRVIVHKLVPPEESKAKAEDV